MLYRVFTKYEHFLRTSIQSSRVYFELKILNLINITLSYSGVFIRMFILRSALIGLISFIFGIIEYNL